VTSLSAPLYIVTGVLLVAGLAKVVRPSATATALRALRIPQPMQATRLLGLVEIAMSIAAIITGAAILWAGIALSYAAFTVFILWALNGNQDVASCGCFGHEDTPPTPGHAAFNAAASAVAALAVIDPVRLSDFDGTVAEGILAAVLIVTGIALAIGALTTLPRTISLARGTAAPSVPTFSLENSTKSPSLPTPRGTT